MASNDGKKLLVFGATMRDHHGLRMKQLLREFRRVPNGSSRAAEFMEMFNLAKELPEDKIEAVQNWLLNGGEFPKWVLPPAPAPVLAPVTQQSGHAHGQGHRQQHRQRHTYHDEFDSDEDDWRGYSASNFNARFGAGQVLHMDPDAPRDEEVPDAPMDRAEDNEATNDMIAEEYTSEDEDEDDWALPLEQPAEEDIAGHDPVPPASYQPKDPNSTDIECGICAEVLEITQFPPSNKIMESCDHDHDMRACFGCLEQNIQSKLDEGRLHLLNCPFCPEIFGYEDVKKYATAEAFAR
jgi:hypothetical protein